jgi:hypothetical protein
MAYREADEGENSIEMWNLCILLLLTLKIPLRNKMIQMTGQSH